MVSKILEFIREKKILNHGDSVILGISGGADSICMLYVLKELSSELNLKLTAVHVNHHIRGEEAKKDMDYVTDTCRKLQITSKVFHIDARAEAKKRGMSEEEAGRACRYECFAKAAEMFGADKIAVAHNMNDKSETILFNLFRGTGIKGLTGIPVKRENIVRPLLCCTRKEIEMYLKENGIEYRTDRTNLMTEYSRNKLRLQLIPYIKENINEKAEYNIVNVGESLGEIEEYLEDVTRKEFALVVKEKINGENEKNYVILEKALELHPAILKRIIREVILKKAGKLKDITRGHIQMIMDLMSLNVSKSVHLPFNLVAEKVYDGVEIKTKKTIEHACICPLNIIENGMITGEVCEVTAVMEDDTFFRKNINDIMYTKWFDYDKINTLTLRNRQAGDYIIIDDKGSTKKLKDYFINEKIPKEERNNMLLLADGNHIVWIIGYRISSYYKVTEETKHIVRVEYK